MNKTEVIERILEKKVIAIVRGYTIEQCVELAKALHKGGVDIMEVTFPQTGSEQVEATAQKIRVLKETLGSEMEFGAGTVTSVEMVRKAHEAGATFIISPDTNDDVIKETVKLGMVSIPGALTPSEMKHAHDIGADFVKVFPANLFGPSYFKTVLAPLSQLRLLAVGGVGEKDIADYLKAGAVGTGVASCLFRKEWILGGEWNRITEATGSFVSLVEENQ
ncbi:MAG: bifunctional 4-hydroxy-2-oxoglutarate aldolase/2-dehydro-3-deoxy-phosphogluconate aldolase [Spirochaetales bacterium]|nr:bifunctional 4-hydroxy-2-oxoglutarate aldolase/2-dehydro-3-deoxy-phosphogluconate aldolase [Spirochaetales bacterium]